MNIVVTGASRGLGYETARILARDRNNTVFALARGQEGLNQLKNDCREEGGSGQIHVFAFDLCKGDYQRRLIPEILLRMKSIDVLVNNAGLLIHKPFKIMEDQDFDQVFHANVKSAFMMIRYLLPYFSQPAHIVNIGSMGGLQGSQKFAGLSLYSASKGALAVLTECLAEELKETNTKVNCLALGSASTAMLAEAFPGYKAPLTAIEMAEFIAHFALNGQKWFNGKIIPVAISTP
jgi:NAD(P)-dependent dehydrogenase (short-subunit alcohol dehydrogenase family)